MSTNDEMEIYDAAPVSSVTGETESYDNRFFPKVIRKREIELLERVLCSAQPTLILDFGCGGGWLSILLENLHFDFIGVDISKKMVRNAKIVSPNHDFIVCDAMNLPFTEDVFDFIIGISILHHLNLKLATEELRRISTVNSNFLFMEPNLLNPFSAFGRKMFPMEAHTEGEKPYTPSQLLGSLKKAGFSIQEFSVMFFLAFPIARFSKITGLSLPMSIISLIYYFELFMERLPMVRHLNSNIVVSVRK